MQNILVIEDEKSIREDLMIVLKGAGYQTMAAVDFSDRGILRLIEEETPDMILLDVNLGENNGYNICKVIRRQDASNFTDIPIIFLTGRDTAMDELEALTIGADDFINKPYHPALLLARIAVILKRSQKAPNKLNGEGEAAFHNNEGLVLSHKGLRLDVQAYSAWYEGKSVELSKTECRLLVYLLQNKERVVKRADIIDYLWDNDVFIDDNALSVNMTRLRNRLLEIGLSDFIKTKRGVGYQI